MDNKSSSNEFDEGASGRHQDSPKGLNFLDGSGRPSSTKPERKRRSRGEKSAADLRDFVLLDTTVAYTRNPTGASSKARL